MDDVTTLAVSKAIAAKAVTAARKNVGPGSYSVDCLVHVIGSMNVGQDYETAPTASIPYKKAFALLCYVSGVTGKAGIAKIRRAMELALANGDDAAEVLSETMPQIERIEKDIIDPMLAGLPKIKAKGKVTTKLVADVVPADRLAAENCA